MKFLDNLRPLGLLALRIALAVIFIYHGFQKLMHSNDAMREFFVQHGLPAYFVGLSGTLEFIGGTLLFIGLFTRPVALLLAIEMCVAIWKVKSVHGVMAVKEYEFELALAAASFALATVGAGLASVDHLVFGEGGKKRRPGKSSEK
jgi:putative oxidoreductase